jgi:cytochrome c biogenesis protein CcmG/thiol:disulfide interchange protein DsbE
VSVVSRGISLAIIVACSALVGLLTYGLTATGANTSIDQALLEGERPEAPRLERELPVLGGDGATGSPADHRGKVVLVNFWASWCKPCIEELPLLQKTHEDMQDKGGLVLGVDSRDLTEKGLAMVDRFNLSFPNLRDRDAELARAYGHTGLPETVVLDRKGRVAALRRGPVTREWLDRTLPALLAEEA